MAVSVPAFVSIEQQARTVKVDPNATESGTHFTRIKLTTIIRQQECDEARTMGRRGVRAYLRSPTAGHDLEYTPRPCHRWASAAGGRRGGAVADADRLYESRWHGQCTDRHRLGADRRCRHQ